MRALRADQLLALPLRLRGILLGRPIDLLLDRDELKVLGFELLSGDGSHRFVPLPTVSVSADELLVSSPLVLLEEGELAFYRTRTIALSTLRNQAVSQDGHEVGVLRDIGFGPDGALLEVIVEADGGRLAVPYDESVRFAARSRSVA
jgi:hypothetical protein